MVEKNLKNSSLIINNKEFNNLNQILNDYNPNLIHYLHILHTKLDCLEGLDKFKNLIRLVIQGHNRLEIKKIELPKLTTLDLGNNNLKSIPNLNLCKNLISLNLDRNHINKISGLNELNHLRFLNLSHNAIQKLDNNLFPLGIEKLSLQHNQIKTPDSLMGTKFPNLTELDLSGNLIEDMKTLALIDLKKLRNLNLNNNSIKEWPSNMKRLENIERLGFNQNALILISENIGQLKNLRILDLSRNSIEKIPKSLIKLKNLEILDLQSNQLSQFPKEVCFLYQISGLYLFDNFFEELPIELKKLKNIKYFNLNEKIPLSENSETLGVLAHFKKQLTYSKNYSYRTFF